jgi:hypothetical protein
MVNISGQRLQYAVQLAKHVKANGLPENKLGTKIARQAGLPETLSTQELNHICNDVYIQGVDALIATDPASGSSQLPNLKNAGPSGATTVLSNTGVSDSKILIFGDLPSGHPQLAKGIHTALHHVQSSKSPHASGDMALKLAQQALTILSDVEAKIQALPPGDADKPLLLANLHNTRGLTHHRLCKLNNEAEKAEFHSVASIQCYQQSIKAFDEVPSEKRESLGQGDTFYKAVYNLTCAYCTMTEVSSHRQWAAEPNSGIGSIPLILAGRTLGILAKDKNLSVERLTTLLGKEGAVGTDSDLAPLIGKYPDVVNALLKDGGKAIGQGLESRIREMLILADTNFDGDVSTDELLTAVRSGVIKGPLLTAITQFAMKTLVEGAELVSQKLKSL